MYYYIELPLIEVLFNSELKGINLDIEKVKSLIKIYKEELSKLEKKIFQENDNEKFNIASSKQLQHILFEKRALKTNKKIKTGYSTDNETLDNETLLKIAKTDKLAEYI